MLVPAPEAIFRGVALFRGGWRANMRVARVCALLLLTVGCGSAPQPSQPARSTVKAEQRYPNGLTAVEEFDLRTKCRKLVDEGSENLDWGGVGDALTSSVYSHYNPNTNRCYAETVATKNFFYKGSDIPDNYRTAAVYDAQTRQMLIFADQEGTKSYGEDVRTTAASLMITRDHGEELIKQLMQDDAQ